VFGGKLWLKKKKPLLGDLIRIIVTLNNGEVNAVELKNDTDVIDLRNAINAIFKLDGPASQLVVRSQNAAAEPLNNPEEILASAVKRDITSGDWEVYVTKGLFSTCLASQLGK